MDRSDLYPVIAQPRMPTREMGLPHRVAQTEATLHEATSSHCFQGRDQRKRRSASTTEAVAVLESPKAKRIDRNGELGMSHFH